MKFSRNPAKQAPNIQNISENQTRSWWEYQRAFIKTYNHVRWVFKSGEGNLKQNPVGAVGIGIHR